MRTMMTMSDGLESDMFSRARSFGRSGLFSERFLIVLFSLTASIRRRMKRAITIEPCPISIKIVETLHFCNYSLARHQSCLLNRP
jgi:hypothetical protein